MRQALDRAPLERGLQLSIAALIVFTVLSQGSLLSWLETARRLRWLTLIVFAALALAHAVSLGSLRRTAFVHLGGALLIGLAVASTAWSAVPRLTFERAAALGLLFFACGAIALTTTGRVTGRRVVDAVVLGAAAVAVGGLLVLLFAHDRAVQPATSALPARYQGLGGGPNTAMMVLAVATPLAVYLAVEPGRRLVRAFGLASALLLIGSIVASGSRGAVAGAFAGLLVFAAAAPTRRRDRLLAAGAVVALLAVAALITRIPQPNPSAPALPSATERPPTVFHGPRKAVPLEPPRLQDDVGHPPFGVAETTKKPRTLFGSSGRAQAWDGALHQGAQRPVAGFGLGTEDRVFVDRYADFNSNVPENSYIGLFLQLGIVGVVAFVGFVLTVLLIGATRLRGLVPVERRLAVACAAAVFAGLVLGGFQSYLYAVGNNATAAFWLSVFMLAALTPVLIRPRRAFVIAGGAAACFVVLAVVGNLERAHRGRDQSSAMATMLAQVQPLGSPALDAYRYLGVDRQCLLYRRGKNPFALELCFDGEGRVIETIDRRTWPKPVIHSLRDDPTRSSVRASRAAVTRLLREFGIPANLLPRASS